MRASQKPAPRPEMTTTEVPESAYTASGSQSVVSAKSAPTGAAPAASLILVYKLLRGFPPSNWRAPCALRFTVHRQRAAVFDPLIFAKAPSCFFATSCEVASLVPTHASSHARHLLRSCYGAQQVSTSTGRSASRRVTNSHRRPARQFSISSACPPSREIPRGAYSASGGSRAAGEPSRGKPRNLAPLEVETTAYPDWAHPSDSPQTESFPPITLRTAAPQPPGDLLFGSELLAPGATRRLALPRPRCYLKTNSRVASPAARRAMKPLPPWRTPLAQKSRSPAAVSSRGQPLVVLLKQLRVHPELPKKMPQRPAVAPSAVHPRYTHLLLLLV